MAYFKSEPLLKAVLAEHIHCNYDGTFTETVPQFITSTTDIRMIAIR